jgi:hypothetical protein
MPIFLRFLNQGLASLQRVVNRAWMWSGALSLGFMLLSMYVTDPGGRVFHWLRQTTGEPSWSLALSAGLFVIFEISIGLAIALAVLRFILRTILLLDAYAGMGVVMAVRQTGASVNGRPVMAVRVSIATPMGPVVATARKLIDLGNIPKPGDNVRLLISRIDPSCVSYKGLC